jgi:hypothetical protein
MEPLTITVSLLSILTNFKKHFGALSHRKVKMKNEAGHKITLIFSVQKIVF